MSKVLVCYFSASGITRGVAHNLANSIEGDLFEIEPVDIYTDEDLDWTNKESRSSREMANRSYRPELKNKVNNFNDYEKIVIGFPVWWDVAPTIINTFIESHDFSKKQVYIFVTSGSSSVNGSITDLRRTYPNINFVVGKRFNGSESSDEYKSFIG